MEFLNELKTEIFRNCYCKWNLIGLYLHYFFDFAILFLEMGLVFKIAVLCGKKQIEC